MEFSLARLSDLLGGDFELLGAFRNRESRGEEVPTTDVLLEDRGITILNGDGFRVYSAVAVDGFIHIFTR